MKLAPKTLIKNFPPKLRELVLKRALEINGLQREVVLEKNINECFTWSETPEKHNFWSNVYSGGEFEWEEEASKEEKWNKSVEIEGNPWGLKRGDRVLYEGNLAYYVGKNTSPTDSRHVIEFFIETGRGWTRSVSVPEDYTPIASNRYWNVSTSEKLTKEITREAVKEKVYIDKPYWAVRVTPENREIIGKWISSGPLSLSAEGFCLCPGHPLGNKTTKGYFITYLPDDCIEISTEEFKKREGIVECVKPLGRAMIFGTGGEMNGDMKEFDRDYGKYALGEDPWENPCRNMLWGNSPSVYKRRTGGTKAAMERMEGIAKEYLIKLNKQPMHTTPYFIKTFGEIDRELREWMGIKSAKKLAGDGVEKLPSAILIYKKEKVKRKLI